MVVLGPAVRTTLNLALLLASEAVEFVRDNQHVIVGSSHSANRAGSVVLAFRSGSYSDGLLNGG
jgi:hypothetical protein